MELMAHQAKAVEELSDGKVLVGGVGTGKTITALLYFYTKVLGGEVGDWSTLEEFMPLYIFTTARKRDELDWQRDAIGLGIGIIPGVDLVVDSYNNIEKYQDIKDAYIILDEQRMVGNGAWVKAFLKMAKNNRWIMLSATPGDKWEDYIPLFIANGFYKNRTEFVTNHIVYSYYGSYPKVERYLGVQKLERLRRSILVEMHYEKHTVRNIEYVDVNYDKELWKEVMTKRWNIFENRPVRQVSELFSVLTKINNSDYSRRKKIEELSREHPRLIVFYRFDFELDILRIMCKKLEELSRGDLEWAEFNGQKHEDIPKSDRWIYLVQYTAGAEAWNCTATDAMVFYSLVYSYRQLEQCMGRIDRLNTPFTQLKYYLLKSESSLDKSIVKAISAKKRFNKRNFVEKLGDFE